MRVLLFLLLFSSACFGLDQPTTKVIEAVSKTKEMTQFRKDAERYLYRKTKNSVGMDKKQVSAIITMAAIAVTRRIDTTKIKKFNTTVLGVSVYPKAVYDIDNNETSVSINLGIEF